MKPEQEKILILDFGSQYTQLIARRIRECRVYSEIHPYNINLDKIRSLSPRGIILSGGPSSVYDEKAPRVSADIFSIGIPILGICYGMQLMSQLLDGCVEPHSKREYGKAELVIDSNDDLFNGFPVQSTHQVWMSHGDRIKNLPAGFETIAHSPNTPHAAIRNRDKNFFGVQFHPEVIHTTDGVRILENFLFNICGCSPSWDMKSFIQFAIEDIRNTVGDKKVICGCSGGVDSTVAAVLIDKAIGRQLTSIFVNNGVLRKNEFEKVSKLLSESFRINLIAVDESNRFLSRLEGIDDPEEKRKIIGNEFISVFEREAGKIGKIDFLAQGTLYPDVIESEPQTD